MKKTTKILFMAATMLLPNISVTAQIHFEQGLSWAQLFAKAKAEHKYIFIDCYATWCGPCKWMDENVYSKKATGNAYNANFICLRLQMDKTANDNPEIKARYVIAESLNRAYHIDAYPTYLFFDVNGKPIHKATGSMSVKDFIALASDAQNPEKQYYTLIKNFQPGKLDTAEEKALVDHFVSTDKTLAARLALDYLNRIPADRLSLATNQQLMVTFQDVSEVHQFTMTYLNAHLLKDNIALLSALNKQADIKRLALIYLNSLNGVGLGNVKNQQLLVRYQAEPGIQKITKNYIDHLPDDSLYQVKTIRLMSTFTKKTADRGFDVFYQHAARIDSIMKDKVFAQNASASIISMIVMDPILDSAQRTNVSPEFEKISTQLSKQYNADLSDRVVTKGKLNWYSYLVFKKKEQQYWTQLIDQQIRFFQINNWINELDDHGIRFVVNNMVYAWIFLHGDKPQLDIAIQWMKQISATNDHWDYMDTYASVLYKAGRTDKAIAIETQIVELSQKSQGNKAATQFRQTLERMKKGEPIWLEKEYQVN
jgi:thioredoxin-related protein